MRPGMVDRLFATVTATSSRVPAHLPLMLTLFDFGSGSDQGMECVPAVPRSVTNEYRCWGLSTKLAGEPAASRSLDHPSVQGTHCDTMARMQGRPVWTRRRGAFQKPLRSIPRPPVSRPHPSFMRRSKVVMRDARVTGSTNRTNAPMRRATHEPASQRLNSADRSLLTTASSPNGGSMMTLTRLLL